MKSFCSKLTASCKNAETYWKVKSCGLLWKIGRCEVDDDAIIRATETAIDHRTTNAMGTFSYSCIWQAHQNSCG